MPAARVAEHYFGELAQVQFRQHGSTQAYHRRGRGQGQCEGREDGRGLYEAMECGHG